MERELKESLKILIDASRNNILCVKVVFQSRQESFEQQFNKAVEKVKGCSNDARDILIFKIVQSLTLDLKSK